MKSVIFFKTLFFCYPGRFLTIVILLVIVSAVEVSSIISIAPVIDMITSTDVAKKSELALRLSEILNYFGFSASFVNFLLLFLTLIFTKSLVNLTAQFIIEKARLFVMKDLICDTYRSFFEAQWNFFVTHNHGTLGNMLIKEVSTVASSFYLGATILSNIFRIVSYLMICVFISWKIFLLILLFIFLMVFPFLFLGRVTYRLGQKNIILSNKSQNLIQESLASAKLILGLGVAQENIERMTSLVNKQQKVALNYNILKNSTSSAMEPIGALIMVAVFYLATQYQKIPIAEIFVMFYALRTSLPIVTQLVVTRNEVQNYLPAWEQLVALKKEADIKVQKNNNKPYRNFRKSISFENVSFSYPGEDPVLENISLVIPKDKMIAIVGPSGGGKTTLIDLLITLRIPCDGNIKVDECFLQDFDVVSWRKKIGYVSQNNILFDATVRDNLLWSVDVTVTDEEIEEACKMAYAHEFIMGMSKGYDTGVGTNGVCLSGGQQQRLALARAILRKPDLLILDEATSALDSKSEAFIQKAVENISQNTTIIVVAHRLSTITKADQIYVLDKGSIVESGTFSTLLKKRGKLFESAKAQGMVYARQ